MELALGSIDPAFASMGLGRVIAVTALPGGTSPVFRVDLAGGNTVVLKVYSEADGQAPERDAFARALLNNSSIPVPSTIRVDGTKETLPFRFALTTYLPGVRAGVLHSHPDIDSLYRQTGKLLRSLHDIRMPAYGSFGEESIANPVSSNEVFMRRFIDRTLIQFAAMGAESSLTERLKGVIEGRFEHIVPHSEGPVFAHDDLHPNNVLAVEDGQGNLLLSGLIDFGNAQAADPVFDLAKCLFCSEHDAPGSSRHILAGYGTIDHPDPEGAILYYTLIHRMVMWWWLRRINVISEPGEPNGLIRDLQQMLQD